VTVSQADLNTLRTINMDTLANGTNITMWSSYSSAAMLSAFELAKTLGFNTVRLSLRLSPSAFAFPSPSGTVLNDLTDACNQAHTAGVKLQLVFYKYWLTPSALGNWGMVDGSETWALAVIGAVQASNLVFASTVESSTVFIEIMNEVEFANTGTYTFTNGTTVDAGYPGYPGPYGTQTNGTVALNWAQILIPYARTQSGGLVTCSCVNFGNPGGTAADLSAGFTGLTGTGQPDWWEWHSYPAAGSVANFSANMGAALTAVGNGPLAIGETGTASSLSGVNAQTEWMQNARYEANQLGLGEPAPWQFFDPSNSTPSSDYALYNVSGNAKPVVYNLYTAGFPPGDAPPQTGTDRWFYSPPNRSRLKALVA
jgi:hypothetical protein